MPKYELLNNNDHQHVKIKKTTYKNSELPCGTLPTFFNEFRKIHFDYPILFAEDNESTWRSVAIVGFTSTENLYIADDGSWSQSYIPAYIKKGPFSINRKGDGYSDVSSLKVNIDMQDARVNTEVGESLFKPMGGNSSYLEEVVQSLGLIADGIEIDKEIFSFLKKYSLLEAINLEYTLSDSSHHVLSGFSTINMDKLKSINASILEGLHRSGWLESIYYASASLDNLQNLVDLKNKKLK